MTSLTQTPFFEGPSLPEHAIPNPAILHKFKDTEPSTRTWLSKT